MLTKKLIPVLLLLLAAASSVTFIVVRRDTPPVAVVAEPRTEAYYLGHPGEMDRRLKDCQNRGVSPMADTPDARDCMAAINAQRSRFFGMK